MSGVALEAVGTLAVDPSWRETFPGAAAGWMVLAGAENPVGNRELERAKAELSAALAARFADRAAIKADPVMAAYAAYYKRFKKTYHVAQQVESVAVKQRPLPKAPALVLAMFMAELETGLLTAGHDAAALVPPVRLMASAGGESYQSLGGAQASLKPDDMYTADSAGILSAVIYGPDRRTRIRPSTTHAAFCTYAPPGVGGERVKAHLQRIAELARLAAPGARVVSLEVHAA